MTIGKGVCECGARQVKVSFRKNANKEALEGCLFCDDGLEGLLEGGVTHFRRSGRGRGRGGRGKRGRGGRGRGRGGRGRRRDDDEYDGPSTRPTTGPSLADYF